MMTDHRTLSARSLAGAGAIVAAALLVAGVLMLWGWNTLAVELFEAPEAEFRHALAAEAMLLSVTTLCVMALRFGRRAR